VELEWTPSALNDLDAAGAFIATENPRAARAIAIRVRTAVEYLTQHPALGRGGRVRGTRELVISGTPFIVVYRVRFDIIQLLRVLHHARKWP
jgi:addiction module RelE/StbE family toxin